MQPVKIGEKFYQLRGYKDYCTTVIDASSNKTGIIIRNCTVSGGFIYTGAEMPKHYNMMHTYHAFFAGTPGTYQTIPYEVLVPAGQGVYWAPDSENSRFLMTYDIQP